MSAAGLDRIPVTLLTFNIRHGEDLDGDVNLKRIASVIRDVDADIVAVQEVDRYFEPRTEWGDQADELSELVELPIMFAANIEREPAAGQTRPAQFGSALLTRHPVRRWHNTALFHSPAEEPRGVLCAELELGGAVLQVHVVHLDAFSAEDRRRQAEQLADLAITEPAVLLGDFNAGPDAPELAAVRASFVDAWTGPVLAGATFPADSPRERIDYVFVSPRVQVVSTEVVTIDPAASDHLPVLSRLLITPDLAEAL